MTSRNLCAECFEIDQPEAFANMQAELKKGCRYCGKRCGATICRRCQMESRRIADLKGLTFEEEWTPERREEMTRIMREIEDHMKKWVIEREPEDDEGPEAAAWTLLSEDGVYRKLAASDPRFTFEAYRFVREAVLSAIERKAGSGPDAHVSGRDVCDEFRMLAIHQYRTAALPTLQGWGIHSTDDIGAVVFRMIEARILGARPEDSPEDFHALYKLVIKVIKGSVGQSSSFTLFRRSAIGRVGDWRRSSMSRNPQAFCVNSED
jgi:uncharacterized repeat protein (TIGR04138 family)